MRASIPIILVIAAVAIAQPFTSTKKIGSSFTADSTVADVANRRAFYFGVMGSITVLNLDTSLTSYYEKYWFESSRASFVYQQTLYRIYKDGAQSYLLSYNMQNFSTAAKVLIPEFNRAYTQCSVMDDKAGVALITFDSMSPLMLNLDTMKVSAINGAMPGNGIYGFRSGSCMFHAETKKSYFVARDTSDYAIYTVDMSTSPYTVSNTVKFTHAVGLTQQQNSLAMAVDGSGRYVYIASHGTMFRYSTSDGTIATIDTYATSSKQVNYAGVFVNGDQPYFSFSRDNNYPTLPDMSIITPNSDWTSYTYSQILIGNSEFSFNGAGFVDPVTQKAFVYGSSSLVELSTGTGVPIVSPTQAPTPGPYSPPYPTSYIRSQAVPVTVSCTMLILALILCIL